MFFIGICLEFIWAEAQWLAAFFFALVQFRPLQLQQDEPPSRGEARMGPGAEAPGDCIALNP